MINYFTIKLFFIEVLKLMKNSDLTDQVPAIIELDEDLFGLFCFLIWRKMSAMDFDSECINGSNFNCKD